MHGSRIPPYVTGGRFAGGGGGGGDWGGYSSPFLTVRMSGVNATVFNDSGVAVQGPSADIDGMINWATMSGLTVGRDYKQRVLLKGDFVIDAPITIDDYMILQLDGKVTLASGANCDLLDATSKSDFEIIGGEWDGDRAHQNADVLGFDINTCDDFLVSFVEIHDVDKTVNAGKAIEVVDCTDGRIVNCYIHDCGIAGEGAGGSGGTGIRMTASGDDILERILVCGNHIHSCNAGIYCYTGSSNSKIRYVRILSNHIYNTTRTGVALYTQNQATAYALGNIIKGNIVIDPARDGAHRCYTLGSSDGYGECLSNILVENFGTEGSSTTLADGIFVYQQADLNVVMKNVVYNVYGRSIKVLGNRNLVAANMLDHQRDLIENIEVDGDQGQGDYNAVLNNYMFDGQHGVYVEDDADYTLIDGNYIDVMLGRAIRIDDVACDETVVINNYCLNIVNATEISDAGTGTVIHNNFQDEGGWVA